MEVKIVSKEKNPFLEREEIEFEVESDKSTPSRNDVKSKLIALTNSSDDKLIVLSITNSFGAKKFKGKAFVYESKEKLKKMHKFFALKRDKLVNEEEIKVHEAKRLARKQPAQKK